jgi:hypothetical protein
MPLSLWPKLFDRYDLCARIAPGVIAVLPIAVALAVHVPVSLPSSALHLALYAAAAAGLAWVVGGWTRIRGRHAQGKLVARWGGMPTELLLRHVDPRIEPATKARYHAALQSIAPGHPIPTAEEEEADPTAALQVYRSAVRRLIEFRREAADSLVLAENASYGFWRNLHGIRLPALILAGAAAIAVVTPDAIALLRDGLHTAPIPLRPVLIAAALLGWCVVLWIIAGEQRVHDAGLWYAERLLGTLDREATRKQPKAQRNSTQPRKPSAPDASTEGRRVRTK